MIIDSLLVALGFEVDTSGADQWIDKARDAETAAIGFVGAIVALAGAVGAATIAVASSLDEIGDFADLNDVSAVAVLELGHAAQLSGSSLDALKSSVQGLNRVAGEAALGIGRGAKLFATLGLSAKDAEGNVKSFDDLLLDIADKMQGLSAQEQIALASKLGIDASLVPMLRKGRDEIEALRQEMRDFGAPQEADFAAAGDLMDSIDRLKAMFVATGQTIALYFLPIVKETVDAFRQWWFANRQLVRDNMLAGLQFFINLVQTVFEWLRRLGAVVNWLIELMGGWRVVLGLLGAALTVFVSAQTLKLLTSFVAILNAARAAVWGLLAGVGLVPILIAAAAAALFLLIDDVVNFIEGNDSVIGRLAERFPAFGALLQQIGAQFRAFWEQFTAILSQLTPMFEMLVNSVGQLFVALWDLLSPVLGAILQVIGAILPPVLSLVQGIVLVITQLLVGLTTGVTVLANLLVGTLTGAINILTASFRSFFADLASGWNATFGLIGRGVDTVKGWFGIGKGSPTPGAAPASALAQGAATGVAATAGGAPMGATTGVGRANSTVNQTTVTVGAPNITVQSPDPARAGEAVKSELDAVNRNAIRNSQSSVAL